MTDQEQQIHGMTLEGLLFLTILGTQSLSSFGLIPSGLIVGISIGLFCAMYGSLIYAVMKAQDEKRQKRAALSLCAIHLLMIFVGLMLTGHVLQSWFLCIAGLIGVSIHVLRKKRKKRGNDLLATPQTILTEDIIDRRATGRSTTEYIFCAWVLLTGTVLPLWKPVDWDRVSAFAEPFGLVFLITMVAWTIFKANSGRNPHLQNYFFFTLLVVMFGILIASSMSVPPGTTRYQEHGDFTLFASALLILDRGKNWTGGEPPSPNYSWSFRWTFLYLLTSGALLLQLLLPTYGITNEYLNDFPRMCAYHDVGCGQVDYLEPYSAKNPSVVTEAKAEAGKTLGRFEGRRADRVADLIGEQIRKEAIRKIGVIDDITLHGWWSSRLDPFKN